MDCTEYFADMSDTPEIQDLAFNGKRYAPGSHLLDGTKVRFQNGDLVYERESKKVFIIYHDTNYRHPDKPEAVTVTNAKDEWCRESIIWMPRRADLQAVYHLTLPKGYSHYQVLFDFCAWTHKNDYLFAGGCVTRGFSLEKVWLIFIMDKVFHMKFDHAKITWAALKK